MVFRKVNQSTWVPQEEEEPAFVASIHSETRKYSYHGCIRVTPYAQGTLHDLPRTFLKLLQYVRPTRGKETSCCEIHYYSTTIKTQHNTVKQYAIQQYTLGKQGNMEIITTSNVQYTT